MVAAFLNLKGYGEGAIARLCSAKVDSSGSGGAELDDGASSCATGAFPLSRLRLDRSPTRGLDAFNLLLFGD